MRIFFIPGFGEDELIFSKIAPHIDGEKVILSCWNLVDDKAHEDMNALKYAHHFISTYQITKEDVLIGHSLGGWIAYHVKHLVNCPVVHIASMTNTDRVILPVFDHPALYWAAKKGLLFNSFTKFITAAIFNNTESKKIFLYTANQLKSGNKNKLVNLLKLILQPVHETITVEPELRIHSPTDNILKPPVQPYHHVSGDHFTLYTHPEEVYTPIVAFLKSL